MPAVFQEEEEEEGLAQRPVVEEVERGGLPMASSALACSGRGLSHLSEPRQALQQQQAPQALLLMVGEEVTPAAAAAAAPLCSLS